MMGVHSDRNPYDDYEALGVIGAGSMGSVERVVRRSPSSSSSHSSGGGRDHHGDDGEDVCAVCDWGPGRFLVRLLSGSSRLRSSSSGGSLIVDSVASSSRSSSSSSSLDRPSSSGGGSAAPSSPSSPLRRRYALKSIVHGAQHDPDTIAELRNEIGILRSLDHPHIAHVIDVYYERGGRTYLVLDLCEGGDLYVLDPYNEREARGIIRQLLRAVGYMHRCGIVHRDLKYENIMFANNVIAGESSAGGVNGGGGGGGGSGRSRRLEIKVIDFGLSKKYGGGLDMSSATMSDFVGTVYTMAPEVLSGEYTFKCDLWSVGVVAYMLLSSRMPFSGGDMKEIAAAILWSEFGFVGERWRDVSAHGKDFVTSLLERDAPSRPTADDAIKKPWLSRSLSSSTASKKKTDGNGRGNGNNGNSTKFFYRRNSSASVGGTALLPSSLHDPPRDGLSLGKVALESRILDSFENYSTYSWMHRLALMVIAYRYTGEETASLRRIFSSYDEDETGTLDVEDLRLQFALHDKYSSEEIDSIFSAVDMTGSGTISWTEFLASTIETLGPVSEEEFSSAFDHLDLDSSGYISTGNLKDILGGKLSQKMLDRIIDEADIIGDHKVWKDEFMSLAKESFDDASDEEENQHQKDVTDKISTGSEGRRGRAASCFADYEYVNAESLNCIRAVIDAEQPPQSKLDLLPWNIDCDDLGANQFVIEKEKSVRKVRQLV